MWETTGGNMKQCKIFGQIQIWTDNLVMMIQGRE